MDWKRGRRRKIEAEELSLFGEALEEIFQRGDILQKAVATAGGIADTTLSQMKVGVRITRSNVRKLIEGLVRVGYLTPDNFEQTAIKLLELADEKPLNKDHKKDADVLGLLCKFQQNGVNKKTGDGILTGNHAVITIPAIECVISYEGNYRYKVKKVLVK